MQRATFLIATLLAASVAHADPPACTDAPRDREVRARLAYLERTIGEQEPPVRRWFTTFALLHATMATGAAILAATAQDEPFRNEMLVGTTSSTLALTTLVVFGPALLGAGDTLRGLPSATPEERLHRLRVAEDILLRSASTVDFLHGWFPATLSSLYVVAASTTLIVAFERPSGAFTHAIGGVLLGLGRVLLHPTGSRDAWRRYARTYADAGCREPSIAPSARLQVVPHALGLGLRLDF